MKRLSRARFYNTFTMSVAGLPPLQTLLHTINITLHRAWELSGFASWLFLATKLNIKASFSIAFHASYLDIMSSFTGDPKPPNAFRGVSF